MRDPFSRLFSSLTPSQDSLLQRFRENFRQLLTPAYNLPSSANGAPIHLPRWERSPRSRRAQTASLIVHTAVITALVLFAASSRSPKTPTPPPGVKIHGYFPAPADLLKSLMGHDPSEGKGSGGGKTPTPATAGNLVPVSSIQLLGPSLPPKRESILAVPPTILDLNAPPVLSTLGKIGLPWMHNDTNSPGLGDSNTIGNGSGHTMGDGPIDGPGGEGDSALWYRAGLTQPTCAYCPDPQYTDEAREAKVQGRVTLRALVSADGRAAQIRIVQGIGFGLDESAAKAVRAWKFIPARDAARRALPAWVTIEAVFRLF